MDSADTNATLTLHFLKLTGVEVMNKSFRADETVGDVKRAINLVTRTPVADLKLLWESEELQDSKALVNYNLPGSANLTLVVMQPLARWARLLHESTGKDFRSQLQRRDAVCKIREILSRTDGEPDIDSIHCLLDGVRRLGYGCSFETLLIYIEALKVAAKGSGNVDVVDFLVSCRQWNADRHLIEEVIGALCEVIGTTLPSPSAIEFAQNRARHGSYAARKFLSGIKQQTNSTA